MKYAKTLIIGSVSALAVGATAHLQADDTLRIGVIGPTTGVFSFFGEQQRMGVELAMEELAERLDALNLEVEFYDSQGDAETTVDRLRAMESRDNVDLVVGPVLGGTGLAGLEWAKGSGMPTVISYSAPEDITMRDRAENVVRAGWTGAQPMFAFGEYVAEELGHQRIVMVGQDYSFPYNQLGGFLKGFCAAGGESVERIWHPTGTSDYSSILATLPDGDALLYNGAGSDGLAFFQQYHDFGIDARMPLLGGSNFFAVGDLPEMGEQAIGGLSALQYAEGLESDTFLAFRDAFWAMHGDEVMPLAPAEHGYVAFKMAVDAFESANGGDRDAVIAALRATEMPDAPRGPFHLDDYGNPVQNIYINEVQEVDGRLVNVPIKTYESVSQFGPFEAEAYLAGEPDSRDFPPGSCADPYYD
ncbi:branched-chain amino acid transport system substrate-binding protein [Franzmannia pantelleriensis]|uniref:Branched-chain amino acid transport system substrate-binding protein n=1 Tax=Franzmannia pantelleriensis TaxID=48727 RepID=A0A1G9KSQ6_9GAMM|nr:ABC transporter substrate-binding protein [Halomonas pantelleriensis]SDL52741.1 branched-chain amino acid transport system substrate-binding protein [Halomonas pantelleriensis]